MASPGLFNYQASLGLDSKEFHAGLGRAHAEAKGFVAQMHTALGNLGAGQSRGLGAFSRQANQTAMAASRLRVSIDRMSQTLSGGFALGAAIGSLGLLERSFSRAIDKARQFETIMLSIAAAQQSAFTMRGRTASGEAVAFSGQNVKGRTPEETAYLLRLGFERTKGRAKDINRELIKRAASNILTYEEQAQAYLVGTPIASKKGLTQEQQMELTEKLAVAAKVLGQRGQQVANQVRVVLSGQNIPRSVLGANLGIGNEVKSMQGKEFFDYLMTRVRGFQAGEKDFEDSIEGMLAQLESKLDLFVARAGKKFATTFRPFATQIEEAFESPEAAQAADNLAEVFGNVLKLVTSIGASPAMKIIKNFLEFLAEFGDEIGLLVFLRGFNTLLARIATTARGAAASVGAFLATPAIANLLGTKTPVGGRTGAANIRAGMALGERAEGAAPVMPPGGLFGRFGTTVIPTNDFGPRPNAASVLATQAASMGFRRTANGDWVPIKQPRNYPVSTRGGRPIEQPPRLSEAEMRAAANRQLIPYRTPEFSQKASDRYRRTANNRWIDTTTGRFAPRKDVMNYVWAAGDDDAFARNVAQHQAAFDERAGGQSSIAMTPLAQTRSGRFVQRNIARMQGKFPGVTRFGSRLGQNLAAPGGIDRVGNAAMLGSLSYLGYTALDQYVGGGMRGDVTDQGGYVRGNRFGRGVLNVAGSVGTGAAIGGSLAGVPGAVVGALGGALMGVATTAGEVAEELEAAAIKIKDVGDSIADKYGLRPVQAAIKERAAFLSDPTLRAKRRTETGKSDEQLLAELDRKLELAEAAAQTEMESRANEQRAVGFQQEAKRFGAIGGVLGQLAGQERQGALFKLKEDLLATRAALEESMEEIFDEEGNLLPGAKDTMPIPESMIPAIKREYAFYAQEKDKRARIRQMRDLDPSIKDPGEELTLDQFARDQFAKRIEENLRVKYGTEDALRRFQSFGAMAQLQGRDALSTMFGAGEELVGARRLFGTDTAGAFQYNKFLQDKANLAFKNAGSQYISRKMGELESIAGARGQQMTAGLLNTGQTIQNARPIFGEDQAAFNQFATDVWKRAVDDGAKQLQTFSQELNSANSSLQDLALGFQSAQNNLGQAAENRELLRYQHLPGFNEMWQRAQETAARNKFGSSLPDQARLEQIAGSKLNRQDRALQIESQQEIDAVKDAQDAYNRQATVTKELEQSMQRATAEWAKAPGIINDALRGFGKEAAAASEVVRKALTDFQLKPVDVKAMFDTKVMANVIVDATASSDKIAAEILNKLGPRIKQGIDEEMTRRKRQDPFGAQ